MSKVSKDCSNRERQIITADQMSQLSQASRSAPWGCFLMRCLTGLKSISKVLTGHSNMHNLLKTGFVLRVSNLGPYGCHEVLCWGPWWGKFSVWVSAADEGGNYAAKYASRQARERHAARCHATTNTNTNTSKYKHKQIQTQANTDMHHIRKKKNM